MICVGTIEKSKESSANRSWEIIIPIPSENPDNKPPLTVVEIILPNAYITMTNNKGENDPLASSHERC
jgi:hypothetical protein